MFVVAFCATIVASQSLISAVFQIAYQAIAQGFFPRFHVYHTSRKHKGQVHYFLFCHVALQLMVTRLPILLEKHPSFKFFTQPNCGSVRCTCRCTFQL